MTHTGYVSANEIMADVYPAVGDPEANRFSEGFLISQIQQALAELAMTTMFDEHTWSHRTAPILTLPDGVIGIDKVFVYAGNECTGSSVQVVWWAKDWFRRGTASFKEQRGAGNNNQIMSDVLMYGSAGTVLHWNTLNNKLHLSDACLAHENVLIKYRGIGCDFGSAPVIPHVLRQAVKDWVSIQCLTHKQWDVKDASVLAALNRAERSYYGDGSFQRPGSWLTAKRAVQSMDAKASSDLRKYLSGFVPLKN